MIKHNASTKLQGIINNRWQPPKTSMADIYAMAFFVGIIFAAGTW